MLETIHFLNTALPLFYLATFIVYFLDFKKQKKTLHNSKRIFLFLSLLFHLFYLLSRTFEFSHVPITNKFEIFTILAFSIACSYFLLELFSDIRGTGVFILGFSVLFQIASSLFIEDLIEVREVLRSPLLGIHVFSALLGFAGLTMAAVYGVLFQLLYKRIKLNTFGIFFEKLPSLETLEKLNFYSVIIGFILLGIAIGIGVIWLPVAFPDYSYLDPKLVSTLLVWIVFGIGIFMKIVIGWYGKKVINFFLVGYTIALLSMFLSNVLAKSFHSFY
ncbi:MAG: cytochrome c biogenesis protein [Bacteroidetes bacterium]|nr:cytochrome c biogenesis protein [Bacteroidota bacterium]MBU1680538.1 cytochrome c biogenesis protein [Bacteroidota bacterium]